MSGLSMLAAVHAAANSDVLAAPAVITSQQQEDIHMAVPATPAAPQAAGSITTAVQLAAAYPDLCAQIRLEGATAERERIVGIEAHALPGHDKLIAAMKIDPAVTPDQAASRVLGAERQLRAGHLQGVVDVEQVTRIVSAAPIGSDTPAAAAPKPSAQQLATRAQAYQAEQSKIGNKISASQAVIHIEQLG
jgi:hypothetical protein